MLSFVCSIGNVPLAAVLWNGGISFGGVVAFIFADLIIVPILFIYRKYYGTRMMLFVLGSFYVTMVSAGYVVEFVFGGLGLVPDRPPRQGGRDGGALGLHHGAQHRVPAPGGGAGRPIRADRRRRHVEDDGGRPTVARGTATATRTAKSTATWPRIRQAERAEGHVLGF